MAPPHTAPGPALVVGCGYLGSRVAAAWVAAGRRVLALTRGRSAELAAAGLEPVVGDVLDRDSLRRLPAGMTTVLYAVGLDRSAGRPIRDVYVDGLGHVLEALGHTSPAARVLYVSSTGVYGQTDGVGVDETSPTEPTETSGRVVLEAERLLRERRPAAVVLRFAGIYGPGRVLRRQALINGEPFVGDADKWLNLIHVEDGVTAVLAAEERAADGATYLIADGTPVTRREFYTESARVFGAPPAQFGPAPAGGGTEPNRRVSNRKAREELGFVPRYPSYREGLAASV